MVNGLAVVTFTVKDSVTGSPVAGAYALLSCTVPGVGIVPFDGHSSTNGVVSININDATSVASWSVTKSGYRDVGGTGTPPATVYLEPVTPPATYTLTISATDGGTTDPSPGSYTYTAGTSVTVTATPSSGYTFNHWELDGANVGAANPITVVMDRDHSLHAVFSAVTPKPSRLPILVAIGLGAIAIGGLYYLSKRRR
jgi:hypothetical protein